MSSTDFECRALFSLILIIMIIVVVNLIVNDGSKKEDSTYLLNATSTTVNNFDSRFVNMKYWSLFRLREEHHCVSLQTDDAGHVGTAVLANVAYIVGLQKNNVRRNRMGLKSFYHKYTWYRRATFKIKGWKIRMHSLSAVKFLKKRKAIDNNRHRCCTALTSGPPAASG